MVAGLLRALARDLNVGLAAAGHLVTAFSLAYAIGAPVIAVLTAELERRRLLAAAMGVFTLANLLATLAPGYAAVDRAAAAGLVRRQLHAGGQRICRRTRRTGAAWPRSVHGHQRADLGDHRRRAARRAGG
jgi:MFS family permease